MIWILALVLACLVLLYCLSHSSANNAAAFVAVFDVPGNGSHVHTHDHNGSEAPDGSPDSILSSEPKPLGKHYKPPLHHRILSWRVFLSPNSKLNRCESYQLVVSIETYYPEHPLVCIKSGYHAHGVTQDSVTLVLTSFPGGSMYRDGGSGGSGGNGNAIVIHHKGMWMPFPECTGNLEGGDSVIGGDGDGVGMAKSLSTLPLVEGANGNVGKNKSSVAVEQVGGYQQGGNGCSLGWSLMYLQRILAMQVSVDPFGTRFNSYHRTLGSSAKAQSRFCRQSVGNRDDVEDIASAKRKNSYISITYKERVSGYDYEYKF
ncbi:hypothetical protein Tco_0098395 [Tanacetum coccineum]|uniref:Uncharacterized protein n=1 Tax=Tanacetum coccineum TaxID=301880 RepID=A0ABQ5CYR7_9ASTR